MGTHIWTSFSRGDRDFDRDIDKRSVVAARNHLMGGKTLQSKVGTVINTNRPYWKERIDGIIGGFEETAEGIQEANPLMPINVADITLRVKYYTAALVLSKNRVNDDGLGLIQKLVPKIMERAIERQEIDFQNMMLGNPTVYDPYRDQRDGVALASVAHPAGPYGALWGNTPATPGALTEQNLATAVSSFMAVRDDNGDLAPLMPQKFLLIVHPSRYQYALQLVNSTSSTADYKNSGVVNAIREGGISYEVYPALYMQSTTAWELIAADQGDTGAVIIQNIAPTVPRKDIKYNPEQVQYFSEMRYSMGITDPRRIFYNPGA